MAEDEKKLSAYAKLAPHYDTPNPPVWQEIKDLLSGIKGSVSVLDVGCGTGRIRQALPAELEYIGLDNSPELLDVARCRYVNNKFIQADARKLPFPDNSFDAVLLIATVHHFFSKADRLQVLAEAQRVLKSGGHLYLSVWNLNRPKFWRQWRGWRKVFIPNQHDIKIIREYYAYTLSGLKKEITGIGFKVNKITYNHGHWLKSRNIVVNAQK